MNARALHFISMTRRENGPGQGLDLFRLRQVGHRWVWDKVPAVRHRLLLRIVVAFMAVVHRVVVQVDTTAVLLPLLPDRRLRNLATFRRHFLPVVPCHHRRLLVDFKGLLAIKDSQMLVE